MKIDKDEFQKFLKEQDAKILEEEEEREIRIRAAIDRRHHIINLISLNFFDSGSFPTTNYEMMLSCLKKKFGSWKIEKHQGGVTVDIMIDSQTFSTNALIEGEAFALAALKTKGIFVD